MVRLLLSRHPVIAAATISALFLASLLDGVGIALVLPLFGLLLGESVGGQESGLIGGVVRGSLAALNLAPTAGTILAVIAATMAVRMALGVLAVRIVAAAGARAVADVQRRLARALAGASWNYFVRSSGGGAAAAIGSEAQRTQAAFLNRPGFPGGSYV